MSCEPVNMPDGTVVLANVRPGAKLTDKDRETIAEWIQFCRDRQANEIAAECCNMQPNAAS
jgi:hypothetical protein